MTSLSTCNNRVNQRRHTDRYSTEDGYYNEGLSNQMISAVLVPPARNQIQIWIIRRSTEGGNRWMSKMWQREIVECQRCGKNLRAILLLVLTASVQAMALTTEKFFSSNVCCNFIMHFLIGKSHHYPLIWTTSRRQIWSEDRGEQITFCFFNHCLKTTLWICFFFFQ